MVVPVIEHRIRTVTVGVTICLLAALPAHAQRAADSVVRDRVVGFKLTTPEGWRLTRQTGYPALLARLTWTAWPKVTVQLSAGRLPNGTANLKAYVKRNNLALTRAVKLRIVETRSRRGAGRDGWYVAAETSGGKSQLRQIYLQNGRKVLVLTLRCPKARLGRAEEELQRMLQSLVFDAS